MKNAKRLVISIFSIVFFTTTCYILLFGVSAFMKSFFSNVIQIILWFLMLSLLYAYYSSVLSFLCIKLQNKKLATFKFYPFVYRQGRWAKEYSLASYVSFKTVFDIGEMKNISDYDKAYRSIQKSYCYLVVLTIVATSFIVLFFQHYNLIFFIMILVLDIVVKEFDKEDTQLHNEDEALLDSIMFSITISEPVFVSAFQMNLEEMKKDDIEPIVIYHATKLMFIIKKKSLDSFYQEEMDACISRLINRNLVTYKYKLFPLVLDYYDNQLCLEGVIHLETTPLDLLMERVGNVKIPSIMKERYEMHRVSKITGCKVELSRKYNLYI